MRAEIGAIQARWTKEPNWCIHVQIISTAQVPNHLSDLNILWTRAKNKSSILPNKKVPRHKSILSPFQKRVPWRNSSTSNSDASYESVVDMVKQNMIKAFDYRKSFIYHHRQQHKVVKPHWFSAPKSKGHSAYILGYHSLRTVKQIIFNQAILKLSDSSYSIKRNKGLQS